MTATPTTPLPLRNDTLLGVCEAIGRDFGFHPNILRIVFASVFYFNAVLVIGVYLGLGLLVAASRWAFPVKVDAESTPVAVSPADNQQEDLPLAA